MNWERKGALLMLLVVVLWTAIPASACLLGGRQAGQPDCCRAMALECDQAGMGASVSCCEVHPQGTTAVTAAPVYSPAHSQKLIFVPNQTAPRSGASRSASFRDALDSPPESSSRGSSILRL